MNKITDAGNRRWYILLGLLATAITFFVFITGKNIPDLIRSGTASPVVAANQGNTNLVMEYFPLFIGSTRTYTIGGGAFQEDGGDEMLEYIGTYTEQVKFIDSSENEILHVYEIEQNGDVFDLDCTGLSPIKGQFKKWYITDQTNLYVACSEEESNEIADTLFEHFVLNNLTPSVESLLPKVVFPLEVNNQWPAFLEKPPIAPAEDTMYRWHVESQQSVETAAGKFNGCFKIVLYTNSDGSFKYICRGAGIIAMEYHHYGSPVNYRVELTSYSLSGNP